MLLASGPRVEVQKLEAKLKALKTRQLDEMDVFSC